MCRRLLRFTFCSDMLFCNETQLLALISHDQLQVGVFTGDADLVFPQLEGLVEPDVPALREARKNGLELFE